MGQEVQLFIVGTWDRGLQSGYIGAECNSGYMGAGSSQGVQLLAVGT